MATFKKTLHKTCMYVLDNVNVYSLHPMSNKAIKDGDIAP